MIWSGNFTPTQTSRRNGISVHKRCLHSQFIAAEFKGVRSRDSQVSIRWCIHEERTARIHSWVLQKENRILSILLPIVHCLLWIDTDHVVKQARHRRTSVPGVICTRHVRMCIIWTMESSEDQRLRRWGREGWVKRRMGKISQTLFIYLNSEDQRKKF